MGRKWNNIKEKKAQKDQNTSRIYAKFGREIYVAARKGDPDPESNQALKVVLERAKTYSVPKHIIEKLRISHKRHHLNGVVKVPIVFSDDDRYAAKNSRIQFFDRRSPLLGSVIFEYFVKNKAAQPGNFRIRMT